MKSKLLILGCLIFSSCAGVELFSNRTFVDEMDRQPEPLWEAGRDFHVVDGDSGSPHRTRREIDGRTPASGHRKEEVDYNNSIMKELYAKEAKLTPQQYQEYAMIKPDLETVSEKIYYLSLSPRERKDYLYSRQMIKPENEGMRNSQFGNYRGLASLQAENYGDSDVLMGMDKDQVVHRWGRPWRVDVAGNPSNENERWTFYENGQRKQVYFEGGKVQGWSIE